MRFRGIAGLLLAVATAQAELPAPKVLERYKQMLAANPSEGTALDRLWKAYSDAGQTAELIREYQSGGTSGSQMILGLLLRKAGQPSDAAAAFTRAAELDPSSPLPRLSLARIESEQGRHAEAAASYEKALSLLPKSDPKLPDVSLALGNEWLAAGDAARAGEAWERTAALDPRNLDLRRRLAESYIQNRLPDRAIPHLEALIAGAPPNERAQALQQLARIHQNRGRFDEAAQALEKAIALTAPENWLRGELQGQLIRLYQRFHRIAELEQQWNRYAAENPRDIGGYLRLIDLYERLGDLEQQAAWLEKLTALAPKTAAYQWKLARLRAELDQVDKAAALYDRLLAAQPGNVDLIFERAKLDIRQKAPQAAKDRIAALLRQKGADEGVRSRALEFYQQNRLLDFVEEHLKADAAGGGGDAVRALANFYFSQRRDADGQAQLQRLARPGDPPEQRAAALFQNAQTLKSENLLPEAKAAADAAATAAGPNSPQARDIQLLRGELCDALDDSAGAREALAQAAALSRTPAQVEECDQKLFNLLSRSVGEQKPAPRAPARVQMTLPTPDGNGSEERTPVSDFIRTLTAEARANPSADAWMRAARWHLWNRNSRAAHDAAEMALSVDPSSVAAHEFLARLAGTEPGSPTAISHLEKLSEIDPAHQIEYARRKAQLLIQAGRLYEALKALESLAKDNPGNIDVLIDLAAAQQRSERWEDALAIWRRIYDTSPPSRRKEALGSLLRIYEHLGRQSSAAELLFGELDAQQDDKEQLARFQDLLAHCAKYGLLPWLRTRWEERRQRFADDYATELAYGRILKAMGEKSAAFEVLSNAALSAPDPAHALPEFVREAEDLHRMDAAVDLQTRLVRLSPQAGPEVLEKLAELQEKNLASDAAAATWEKVALRFPRDVGALTHAAEFHLRYGDSARAAELLRSVRSLDPASLQPLLPLARADVELGRAAEAEDCLEQILRDAPPLKPDAPIRLPGLKPEEAARLQGGALALRSGRRMSPSPAWAAPRTGAPGDPRPETDLPLVAARELGQLIRGKKDTAALNRWADRWKAEAGVRPAEALWALFYAGAGDAALDLIERLIAKDPSEVQYRQAFVWVGIQAGRFTRLGAWLRDARRPAEDRDFVRAAIEQQLQSSGAQIAPEQVGELFPAGAHSRVWQAAELFAARGRLDAASVLGRRVFAASTGPQRVATGVELAHWRLCMGDVETALQIAAEISRTPGESFDSASYIALRETYLLLPPAKRQPFVTAALRSVDRRDTPPVHAAITRILLHGLSGNDDAAREEVRRLYDMRVPAHAPGDDIGDPGSRPSSAARLWNFQLSAGLHLQAWHLDRLAVALWEDALADPGLIRLQGEQAQETAREARTRLYSLKIAHASGDKAGDLLDEYVRGSGVESLTALGEALESMGAPAQAIEVYRRQWEREPLDRRAMSSLLTACNAASDFETAETVLRTAIRDRMLRINETMERELVFQLADLQEKRGALEEAIQTLEAVVNSTPRDPRVAQRLAQLYGRAGKPAKAQEMLRLLIATDSPSPGARAALASLLESQGKMVEAIAVLERGRSADTDGKLAELYFRNGQTDEAFSALDRLTGQPQIAVAQGLARTMLERGERKLARTALQIAAARNTDPAVAMQIQGGMIESLAPEAQRPVIARELRKLRRMAGDDPARLGVYFSFLQTHAREFGLEEAALAELRKAWSDGAGVISAGAVLLAWHLDHKDPSASRVVDQFVAHRDVSELWLQALLPALANSGRLDLSARVQERLVQFNPLDDERILRWVRTLNDSGQADAARAALTKWSARAPLNTEFAAKVARLFMELGAAERAEPLLEQVVRDDPYGRNYRARLDLAQIRTAAGKLPEAKKLLAAAYRQPANREFEPLLNWLQAAGQLSDFDAAIRNFPLTPARVAGVRRELFAREEKANDLPSAAALLDAHPEIEERDTASRLRAMAAKSGRYEPAAAVLEKLQAQAPRQERASALALLLCEWADAELAADRADAALSRLRRACQLAPDLFPAAKKLSGLQRQRGDLPGAAATLEAFRAASGNAQEKEQATVLLREIKPM